MYRKRIPYQNKYYTQILLDFFEVMAELLALFTLFNTSLFFHITIERRVKKSMF